MTDLTHEQLAALLNNAARNATTTLTGSIVRRAGGRVSVLLDSPYRGSTVLDAQAGAGCGNPGRVSVFLIQGQGWIAVGQGAQQQSRTVVSQRRGRANRSVSTLPSWACFGSGFAVAPDADAAAFTESRYPAYEEYPAGQQGSQMFPGGSVRTFAVAATDLWVAGGVLGNPPGSPATRRLPFAMSIDQGVSWDAATTFATTDVVDAATNLVWGDGAFFAIAGGYWRSSNGTDWSQIPDPGLPTTNLRSVSLATWNDTVYLLASQSTDPFAFGSLSSLVTSLLNTLIYRYHDSDNTFQLVKTVTFSTNAQYGAYYGTETSQHVLENDWLLLPQGLYPFLLSSGDLTMIPTYGSAVYNVSTSVYFNQITFGTNQNQVFCTSSHIDGQTFLMLPPKWGLQSGIEIGFAAIYEGTAWRTCTHPFVGLSTATASFNLIRSLAYSADAQTWLVYGSGADGGLSLGDPDSNHWSAPFRPTLDTEITANTDIALVGVNFVAISLDGNYIS